MNGQVSFFELGTGDVARAREFYTALFGWRFSGEDGGARIETPNVPGGIHPGDAGGGPYLFFQVEDIEAALERVRELGGSVGDDFSADDPELRARFGRFVYCTDDQGSSFGLHEPPR